MNGWSVTRLDNRKDGLASRGEKCIIRCNSLVETKGSVDFSLLFESFSFFFFVS